MKIYLKEFLQHTFIRWSLILSFFLNILNWVLLAWRLVPRKDTVILHYSVYFGVDWFGPAWYALSIPSIGFIILLVNVFIGVFFWKQDNAIAFIVMGTTIVLELLLLLSAVLVVLVNV